MSDRILKHSINKSESLGKCSIGANLLFDRLLLETDDHGCFDARAKIIRPLIFPLLMDKVQESDIDEWKVELVNASCYKLWQDEDGKKYGMYINFSKYNSLRTIHDAHTPCPPWLLDKNGCDPRISTKSEKPFKKIEEGFRELGEDATYKEIVEKTGASKSTIAKYKKQFPGAGSSNGKDVTDNFEKDWEQYPRKAGDKKKAKSCYLKTVTTPEKRKAFLDKMSAYVASVDDPKYFQHGEKFFRNWESLVVAEKIINQEKQTTEGSKKLEQIERLIKEGPGDNLLEL